MHRSKNMVGARTANYDVSLFKRYFRISRHSQPGIIKKAVVALVAAIDIKVGVVVYG